VVGERESLREREFEREFERERESKRKRHSFDYLVVSVEKESFPS
jgi:hypothetical protein